MLLPLRVCLLFISFFCFAERKIKFCGREPWLAGLYQSYTSQVLTLNIDLIFWQLHWILAAAVKCLIMVKNMDYFS